MKKNTSGLIYRSTFVEIAKTHPGRKARPKTTKIGGSKVVKMVVVQGVAAGLP